MMMETDEHPRHSSFRPNNSLLVVPGQVIATSSGDNANQDDSFLRGHGTYLETTRNDDADDSVRRVLVASIVGTVVRVNKLILVESASSRSYNGHVGDLIVGRIASVGNQRWNVQLNDTSLMSALPLSGIHLPGGVQRIRTAQDVQNMRSILNVGDLVSAEVHKVQPKDGTLLLHTRSTRYHGKLENGCSVQVPPSLIPRLKHHSVRILSFDVLLGCNGRIWMQRQMQNDDSSNRTINNINSNNNNEAEEHGGGTTHLGQQELAEFHERQQQVHRDTPYSLQQRQDLARLRNSILCLARVWLEITPQRIQHVYTTSLGLQQQQQQQQQQQCSVVQMLQPETILQLTEQLRKE